MAVVPETQQAGVMLSWENDPITSAALFETGIEASTNLRDWTLVVCVPYEIAGTITMIKKSQGEFYRVFNRRK